jgi:tetratricopeptide (TPR) repeat protein
MRPAPFLSALVLLAGSFAVTPVMAAPKPVAPAPSAAAKNPRPGEAVSEEHLFARLAKAQSAEDAKPIAEKLETMFRASGSPSVDLLMNRAEVAAAANDKAMAKKLLDSVTTIAPNFAEGWHARAAFETASGDDTSALISLQKVVQLNPRQFNALSELAGMLEDYGDKAGALKLYRRAFALNPQLEGVERHLHALAREVEGQDI